jgi:hypothetical protein
MTPASLPPTFTELPPGGAAPTLREVLAYHVQELRAFAAAEPDLFASFVSKRGLQADAEPTFDTLPSLVASEHGFRDWADAVTHGDRVLNRRFEAAVDAVVNGDLAALERYLREEPGLITARSAYGHRATLLHYIGANGVERAVQRSPANAAAIARVLLAAGADPNATANFYGSTTATTLGLLVSSCFPAEAGVQADVVEVLCRGGAKPNGIADDGAPLWTAITGGYTDAALRLVACGALVDNVIAAAVVGDVAAIESYFDSDGRLRPVQGLRGEHRFTHGRALEPGHMLEYALIYGALHGRDHAVAFLLSKEPDLSVREPVHGGTALGMAKYRHRPAGRPEGSPAIVELLEAALRGTSR